MSNTINFGIDLGTTNSAVAKYSDGQVEVFKNPIGHKETLPSVVAFRNQRIIVGDKAREYIEKDPANVVGFFKRRMGTSDTYHIEALNRTLSPIDLSAIVLKELKNFIYTEEPLTSAVITIPASFDTIQSNATKKAGHEAGIQNVFLLQEPVAASLAFANKDDQQSLGTKQWLVYDLGGGTFDVALVRVEDDEMKVSDHQGDNFLGGVDFDNRILDEIVIPYVEKQGKFDNLSQQLKSGSGRLNKLYYILLKKAEDVKVTLSGMDEAEIEFEIEDDDGELLDIYFTITRSQFEDAIREKIQSTVDMIRTIIERNDLTPEDIGYVLMVGGSTYIPLVKKMISESLQIKVNFSIDPTTAIVVGAGYYAGTKPVPREPQSEAPTASQSGSKSDLEIRTAYQKATQDKEEYFTAQVTGKTDGLFYRIVRTDGGFDTGLKELEERVREYLPLAPNMPNSFTFKVFDKQNNPVAVDVPSIEIIQGKFSMLGQPLPNDICLEVDDFDNNATKLEVVFEKNAILPMKRTVTKEITKTIRKGDKQRVIINVLEGPQFATPSSLNSIGTIEIKGQDLNRDLVKGSDIEIAMELSESRDLRITTYLFMTDQEFTNLFNPSERCVIVSKLIDELHELGRLVRKEIREAESREDFEIAEQLNRLRLDLDDINAQAIRLTEDDVTDTRFQLEDKKRRLSLLVNELTKDKKLTNAISDYYQTKKYAEWKIEEHGTELEKKELQDALANEKELLASNMPIRIEEASDKISRLTNRVMWRQPERVISIFYYYCSPDVVEKYRDRARADQLIKNGNKALERQNYDELRVIINQLYGLLPPEEAEREDMRGTGIS